MKYRKTNVLLRALIWALAIVLGAASAWLDRHEILSDGISYVEIATRYLNGDWSHALNAYWSPLFSWTIALAFWVLRPSLYWQVGVVHLVIFLAYLAGLFSFELFLRELLLFALENEDLFRLLPDWARYIGGYCSFLFASLSMIGTWFCYPDMLALALTLFLMVIMLRIRRTGGSHAMFVAFGLLCALLYLARTAFIAPMLLCIVIALLLLKKRERALVRPAAAIVGTILLLTVPYVAAISAKDGRFTIGNSGALNLAWEIDGARRWVHWQGEPGDLGTPRHSTTLALASPATYTFAEPIETTYGPWYDPSYFYAGIEPKLEIKKIAEVLFVNLTVFGNVLLRSPVFLPVLVVAFLMGLRRWLGLTLALWPVLLPMLASVAFYALIYIERRYIAANLLIFWVALLFTVRLNHPALRRWAPLFIVCCALLFTVLYGGFHLMYAVKRGLSDLVHRREGLHNVNWILAARFRSIGLCPGDRVAYIGPGMHAEWARLDDVRVVGEVPLTYSRGRSFLNNLEIDRPDQVKAYFAANEATRERVRNIFRQAGARMLVTEGFFSNEFVESWPRVLPEKDPHLPLWNKYGFSQLNTRYQWLVPEPAARREACPALARNLPPAATISRNR